MIKQYLGIYIIFCSLFYVNISQAEQMINQAAIATAHPLATKAGQETLLKGGNAFDAAISITAALAVVEPYSSGIGGGGFWMLHSSKTNKIVFLDGREKAPLAATKSMYLDSKGNYIQNSSVNGPLAAGIPGTIAALQHLSDNYGKLNLAESLQPAIKLAEDGFKVSAHYQKMVTFRLNVLRQFPDSSKIFLHNNEVPEIGYKIIQKQLAETLKTIAAKGQKGFYEGEIAAKLVKSVLQNGGIWSLKDLAKYQVVERAPIKFNYKGMSIFSAPPPSSGGIVLNMIFNILERYPLKQLNQAQVTHIVTEAMRRAYHDRAQYMGDSDFISIPTKMLRSKNYAAGLAASIHTQKATPSHFLSDYQINDGGKDTTHFVVRDSDGNSVSATMSINYPFGSGFVAQGTGVLLNDEMDDFSAKAGVANVYGLVGAKANEITPEKRPLSSMSPSYIEFNNGEEKGEALIGTPGGSRIITMVLLAILDMSKSTDPEHWVNLPRYHHQYLPDVIQHEINTFTKSEKDLLGKMGHELKIINNGYGNMQALIWRKNLTHNKVTLEAASDKRGEGKAWVSGSE